MLTGFLLSLREGFEAALIVGVLLGTLKKLKRENKQRYIWMGVGTAILLSGFAGFFLNRIGAAYEGKAEEIFEGAAMLLAAGILTWVILWMQNQSKTINKELEAGVQQAVIADNQTALFLLAFLSVFREGIELAIFLVAASMSTNNSQVLIGTILGMVAVIVFALLLFRSLIRLDVAKFFRITSIMLIVFAAGLVAHGIHELNEAGIVPSVIEHVWDINHILNEKSTIGEFLKTMVGYNGNPSLTEVVSYFLYFVVIFVFSQRPGGKANTY